MFSESTVGGAGGVSCFVLFFFFFCVLLAFSLLLSSTTPPRCLCTLCCSTAVSWWNLRYLIWSTCCPVLPDSMRKMFFCHSFLFCTLLFAVALISLSFYLYCPVLRFLFVCFFWVTTVIFYIYIFCDFFFVCFLCFIHQSRLIRSCYILFIKQQAFGKLKKK